MIILICMLKTLIVGVHMSEAVLTSTHNLCFGTKIRKIGTPAYPSFTIESGV